MSFDEWKRHIEALIPGCSCKATRNGWCHVTYRDKVVRYGGSALKDWSAREDADLKRELGIV